MDQPASRSRSLPAIHPWLIALLPIVQLYGANIDFAQPRDVALLAGALLLLASTLLLLLTPLLARWAGRAVVTSVVLLLFFHFAMLQAIFGLLGLAAGPAATLALALGAAVVAGAWWVARDGRGLAPLNEFLNVASSVLLLLLSINIAVYLHSTLRADWLGVVEGMVTDTLVQPLPATTGTPPDVYYIMLDGYGRADVLDALYGVDNQQFIGYLEARGFYVAPRSHTNYPRTTFSLLSTLNMQYLDPLSSAGVGRRGAVNVSPSRYLMQRNAVVRSFKAQGYEFVLVASGYDDFGTAQNPLADEILCNRLSMNPLMIGLYNRTPLTLLGWEKISPYTDHRRKVTCVLEALQTMQDRPGPQFIFAHLLAPHPPFLWDPAGEVNEPSRAFALNDANHFEGSDEEYVTGYAGQLRYINGQLQAVVDAILARSAQPPVIILQGDHGPGLLWEWDDPEGSYVPERFGIFAAYYLPALEGNPIPPDITPVNTFRILFNSYFDANMPLLPNRSYTMPWDNPFDQHLLPTERLVEPLPPVP